jgi:hypothetical protein
MNLGKIHHKKQDQHLIREIWRRRIERQKQGYLLAFCFHVHIDNSADNNYGQHNKAGSGFAFVLAHQPDKKCNERQYKNCPKDEGWNVHVLFNNQRLIACFVLINKIVTPDCLKRHPCQWCNIMACKLTFQIFIIAGYSNHSGIVRTVFHFGDKAAPAVLRAQSN